MAATRWLPAARLQAIPLWSVPVLVAPLLLAVPFFFGEVFLFRDVLQFAAPIEALIAKAIAAGHLPQWNPLLYGGTPLLAELDGGIFYPPNLVFQLLTPPRAATAFVLLHLPLAGLGAYSLGRWLGTSKGASAIAATGFVTSGYLLSMHGGYFYFAAAAGLPFVTTLLVRVADAPSPRRAAFGGLGIALLIFNGDLQVAFFAGVLALVLTVGTEGPRTTRWRSAFAVAATLALGALLGAIQLWPTLAYAGSTTRAHGLSLDDAATWALAPVRWLELLVPQPYGISYPENTYWGAVFLDAPHRLPWAPSLYIGPLFVLLALGAGWKSLPARSRLLLAVAGTSLLLAAGKTLPFFSWWLRLVPLANRFRYPEKFALVASLALILVGAQALDLIGTSAKRTGYLFVVVAGALTAAATSVALWPGLLDPLVVRGLALGSATASAHEALHALSFALLRTAALCVAVWLLLRLRLSQPKLGDALLLGLVLVDGVTVGANALSFGDGDFLAQPPSVMSALREAAPEGSTGRFWSDRSCHFPGTTGDGTLLERVRQWEWSTGKENFPLLFGVPDITGYGAAESPDKIEIFHAVGRSDPVRAARLFGAATRLSCTPAGEPMVTPIDDPLPRAFVVPAREEPAAQVVSAMSDPTFDPRLVALLEGSGPPPTDQAPQVASIVRDAPEDVTVRTSGAAGVLVLADSFADGWTATVDGARVPIREVDGLWRGVEMSPGPHEVEFHYETPGLRAGATASIVGVVLSLFLTSTPVSATPMRPLERRHPEQPAVEPGGTRYRRERIEHWNAIAKAADRRTTGRYYHRRLAEIFRHLVAPGQTVLELGCGQGDLLAALEPSQGVGLDFSSEMIGRARARHPRLEFREQDVHEMEVDRTFDVVILSDLVNDLWDVQAVLERAREACRPDTRILLNVYSRLWELPLALAETVGLARPVLRQNWLTVEDVSNLLRLAGYETLRTFSDVVWPVGTPLVADLANAFLAKMMPFRAFALANFVVARPAATNLKRKPTVSVVVPARNEAGNIEAVFERTPEMGAETELIFVEGHSKDDTWGAIARARARHPERRSQVLRQTGKGKGDAVRAGFAAARGDILMILDADLTMPPEDLPRFYDALVSGKGEFVNGVRLLYPMEDRAMQFLNLLGNKFFSLAFSWLLDQPIKDTLCGTKVLRRQDYEAIAANRSYFGDFDPFGDFDLLFGAAKQNLKLIDVPVRYRERTYGTTNIQRYEHGLLLLRMVLFAARRIKFV